MTYYADSIAKEIAEDSIDNAKTTQIDISSNQTPDNSTQEPELSKSPCHRTSTDKAWGKDYQFDEPLAEGQFIIWKTEQTVPVDEPDTPMARTIQKRRLALAGHVARHEEMAAKVLLWEPDAKRKRGRPNLTLKKVLEEEVGLKDYNLLAAMLDRNAWLDIVNGTSYEDDLN
ncbi:Hypp6118 [Branchiostoma lanceolatum]|uniref:Hypp6118 protein n=1 Tax=Branchiostoma lanceolatum TaxID=7740 RepID=A0A8J9VI68_BRALA|nr:Hypp6118 [Branchiostoma lanceolatum]